MPLVNRAGFQRCNHAAGVHAGPLIGADATQVLTDEDTLVKSLLEVNRLYKPDGQPVVFDLQLEAEILGCELVWAKDAPPACPATPWRTP